MTNQETIETLNTMLKDGRYLGNGTHIPLEVLETFNKAIEALENQKSVIEEIEKIKDEMIEKCKEYRWDNDDVVSDGLIRIIDNHIKELKGK